MFLINLGAKTERTLSRLADHTTLGGNGSLAGWQAVIQKDIDRLKEESSRNLMRFSAGGCRALALTWEHILLVSGLGINWLESSFVKKDPRAPVDDRGNMSQQ